MTQSNDEFVFVDACSAVTSKAQTLSAQGLVNQEIGKVSAALLGLLSANFHEFKTRLANEPPIFPSDVWDKHICNPSWSKSSEEHPGDHKAAVTSKTSFQDIGHSATETQCGAVAHKESKDDVHSQNPYKGMTSRQLLDKLEGLEALSRFNSIRDPNQWVSEESEMKRSLLQEKRTARTLKLGSPTFGIASRLAEDNALPWPVEAQVATRVDKVKNFKVEAEVVFEGKSENGKSISEASRGAENPSIFDMTDEGRDMQKLLERHSQAFGGRITIL